VWCVCQCLHVTNRSIPVHRLVSCYSFEQRSMPKFTAHLTIFPFFPPFPLFFDRGQSTSTSLRLTSQNWFSFSLFVSFFLDRDQCTSTSLRLTSQSRIFGSQKCLRKRARLGFGFRVSGFGFRVSVVCLFVCLFVWLVGWLVVYLFVYYCLFIYLSSGAAIQVAGDLGACDLHVLRGELYILFVRLFQR
jgi:hypothetical protein